MEKGHDILDLCAALNVSRSGDHAWESREPAGRAQASAALRPLIQEAGKPGDLRPPAGAGVAAETRASLRTPARGAMDTRTRIAQ